MELLKDFRIKDIVISEDYKSTLPREDKQERAEQRYLQTGELPTNIVVNDSDVLIDGYITYLLAVKHGIKQLDIYRGCVEIVEAVHYTGSNKAYTWRVPLRLNGMIEVNDYIIVPSSGGVKRVKVLNVIRQQYPEQSRPLKQIYKKCGSKQERSERTCQNMTF